MGLRLKVSLVGDPDEWITFDQKFFGYVPFKTCCDSFTYLYNCSEFRHEIFDDCEDAAEGYEIFTLVGAGEAFILSAGQFMHFADLYLVDVARWMRGADRKEVLPSIESALDDMSHKNGNKLLVWE